MLSDIRLFGILHRIQLATHAKIFAAEDIGDSLQTLICNDHDLLEVKDFVKASMINSRVSQRRDYNFSA
jgi:hypothetical protein